MLRKNQKISSIRPVISVVDINPVQTVSCLETAVFLNFEFTKFGHFDRFGTSEKWVSHLVQGKVKGR